MTAAEHACPARAPCLQLKRDPLAASKDGIDQTQPVVQEGVGPNGLECYLL